MPTLIDRLLGRTPQKASTGGTGAGVSAYYNDAPLWTTTNRSPRRLMRQAQELYHSHPWVHDAEFRISSTAAGVKWHLEDEDENEVDDTSPPELQAIRDLIEKPQENVDPRLKRFYRRSLWQLTFRHQGLCGNAFWYKDQRQGVTGIPAAFLYINPTRMTPAYDKAGNTIGWKLDAEEDGSGGVPITLDEIVQFELDPPDVGAYGIGIVESAGMKVQLTTLADRHVGNVLASGGRLTGMVAPKDGSTWTASDDDWKGFVNDYRNISEDPQAAKRLQISKYPIDYTRTSATLTELQIEQVMKMGREDIFALWGIPLSQVGVQLPRSLNSGQTQSFEEATLWQGPIHSRLVPFKETIQYGILDEIARAGGPKLDLVLDEPEFDDDTPAYDKAQKAVDQPLTENERRSILKLDPLPDVDTKGEPLGVAIYRPANLILVSSGPDASGNLIAPPAPPPPPAVPPPNPFGPPSNMPPNAPFPLKARIDEPLRGLRRSLDTRWTPAARKSVSAFLRSQASDVAGRIRKNGAHLVAKPKDKALWWDPKAVDAALAKVLLPHATGIALQVAKRAQQTLAPRPAKADTFAETVAQFVRDRAGTRITKINETTRDDIAALIAQGFDEGLSPAEIADLIEGATAFDDARAELIARTESALAYNEAALSSYTEFGVSEVQATDGDGDPECAERDGQIYSVEEAMGIEDHPNGTLDWSPVVGEPVAKAELDHQLAMKAIDLDIARAAQPAITVNTPDIHVAPPSVTVAAPNVVVDTRQFAEAIDDLRTMLNKPKTRRVERDENGRAIAVHEE